MVVFRFPWGLFAGVKTATRERSDGRDRARRPQRTSQSALSHCLSKSIATSRRSSSNHGETSRQTAWDRTWPAAATRRSSSPRFSSYGRGSRSPYASRNCQAGRAVSHFSSSSSSALSSCSLPVVVNVVCTWCILPSSFLSLFPPLSLYRCVSSNLPLLPSSYSPAPRILLVLGGFTVFDLLPPAASSFRSVFFFLFFFFLFPLFLSAIQLFTSLSSSLPSCPTVTVTFFLRFLPLPSPLSANSVFPSSRTLLLLERCPRSVRGFLDLGRWPRVKWWYKINCVARNYCPGKLCEENRGDVFTTHWDDRVFPRIFFKTFVNVVEVEKTMLLFDFTRRTTYASFSWFRLVFERMGCHLLISYSRIS